MSDKNSDKNSWIWKYVKKLDKSKKCNQCKRTFTSRNSVCLKYHLYHDHNVHNDEDNLRWKNDTDDRLWQYYSKLDGYVAQCKDCKTNFQGYSKSSLAKHLYRVHEEIVDTIQKEYTGSWLSKHFEFTNLKATCKCVPCRYSINIFQKTDLLIYHLKTHNIHEDSKCEEKSEDAVEMIQQSVDKTNAGPSSSHDDTHRQSLIYQESQQGSGNSRQGLEQGFEHEPEQETESHDKIWKPYTL